MPENKKPQELKDLEDKLEKIEKKVKGVERDVYSPEAQAAFEDYKGTREEFVREADLRKVASGKRDTRKGKLLSFIAAAAFGDQDLVRAINARYQEKYSREEIEEAKAALEKEFGVKKKKDQDAVVTRKFRKIVKDEVSPIKESILGLAAGVDTIGKEIQRANTKLKSISDNLVGTINSTLTALAGGRGDLDRAPDRIKPVTVADAEGSEYLYYPDAPPGRQLYEKSKVGTAGRIASKKVQRELEQELKRVNQEQNLEPVRVRSSLSDSDSVVDRIKVLLEEESMFRKRDMEQLLGELKLSLIDKNKTSVSNLESDEQEAIMAKAMEKALKNTLYNALKEVFERNPELLDRGGILDTITSTIAGLGTAAAVAGGVSGLTAAGAGAAGAAGGAAASKTGLLARLVGAVSVPLLGAASATGLIFGGIDYGLKQSGDKAIRNISKGTIQDIATAIQVPKYGAYTLQELEKMATQDSTLKTKLDKAKEIAGLKPKTSPEMTLSPPASTVGQQIVDQNQKRIEIQSAEKVEIPAQTVNNINNTSVIPIPAAKKNIEVHNNENTFNRLLAQEFDHPATYTSMSMG